MAEIPFDWWSVLIVTLVGTALWLIAIYYAAISVPREEVKERKSV